MIDDNELIDIFIEEMQDLNASLKNQLASWKTNPHQKESIDTILREMHTLKGNARMIGLSPFSEYLHALEQLWQTLKSAQFVVEPELINTVIQLMDVISKYAHEFAKTKKEPQFKLPIESVKKCIEDFTALESGKPNIAVESIPAEEAPSNHENEKDHRTFLSDSIRVKIEDLNKFAQLAVGINVDRAHCDQQNKTAIHGLVEIEKELKFLFESVKQLQIKTDANIKAQVVYGDAAPDQEFDVLEMDYYNSVQQLTRQVADKINLIQNMNAQVVIAAKRNEQILRNQGRLSRQLDEDIRHTRLISLDYIIPRLEHTVASLSEELGKSVDFKCDHIESEIDRKVIDKLIAPLEHLIRNAIDHGIGRPEIRKEHGKPEQGTITLSMQRQGNDILITLADDGRGIDISEIKAIALRKNLWDGQLALSDQEFLQMIFLSGFSTKKVATEISGHGVGLDVVNTAVNKLGGTVTVKSRLHYGTTFSIMLPVSLSLSKALLFYMGDQLYGISLSQLAGISRLPYQTIQEKLSKVGNNTKIRGVLYALYSLPTLLDNRTALQEQKPDHMLPLLLLRSSAQAVGFVVDKLVGSAEIVIQPIGTQLHFAREFTGVSMTGSGDVILLLDAMQIMQRALNLHFTGDVLKPITDHEHATHLSKQSSVLVVEDSNTVRQIMSRFLQRNEFKPMIAKNGEEALQIMRTIQPELVLLDLEMPIMNGYEVLQKMKEEPLLKEIPVIVITSRSGEKHQQRAMALGARAYVTKPYRETDLLALIEKYVMRA